MYQGFWPASFGFFSLFGMYRGCCRGGKYLCISRGVREGKDGEGRKGRDDGEGREGQQGRGGKGHTPWPDLTELDWPDQTRAHDQTRRRQTTWPWVLNWFEQMNVCHAQHTSCTCHQRVLPFYGKTLWYAYIIGLFLPALHNEGIHFRDALNITQGRAFVWHAHPPWWY